MVDERHEYQAVRVVTDPGTGRPAYLPGQPIHAQVVEDWGLQVGTVDDEDALVMSLRPQEMARPASNASREEWLRYRLGQPGADREQLDQLGRNALRDLDEDPVDDDQPGEPADDEKE